ncbi:MAG: cytochrome c biogenesis protein CcsA [Calditrichia bacterium]
MNLGMILIWLAFFATLFSGGKYWLESRKYKPVNKERKLQPDFSLARYGFYIMSALVAIATFYLGYLFLTHQFQYEYVYRYSSRQLPLGLLISALWAGQEGSFLLWALFIAVLGMAYQKTSREHESYGMVFVNLVQAFFLAILLKASPFAAHNHMPPDGSGLNPLLQNFWMIIHPPILFLGYAAATFPMALAVSALVQKKYSSWNRLGLPWTLLTSVTLGAGIIIGAFWAYEVLGWGGYWGWDPVENSSLIPWITSIILLHGLLVERKKGQLLRTNYFFAIITFVLVVYATFLTRSGILADFSVHSFQDLGINLYLLLFLFSSLGIGLILFLRHWKEIPQNPVSFARPTRENALLLSLYVLLGLGLITWIGTSLPIISGFFGKASQVDASFYNRVNLPLGIGIGLLLGITPFLKWNQNLSTVWNKVAISLGLAILSAIPAAIAGLQNPLMLLFCISGSFAILSNLFVFFQQFKAGWAHIGAPLAHMGIGIMLVSIVISGQLSRKEIVVLSGAQSEQALERELTYKGAKAQANGKDIVQIEVQKEQDRYLAEPRLYYSKYNRGYMHEPDVKRGILQDIYIAPLERRFSSQENSGHNHTVQLRKGETQDLDGYQVHFADFKMMNHSGEGGGFKVGAELHVLHKNNSYAITPSIIYQQGQQTPEPAVLPAANQGQQVTFSLAGIDADQKIINLQISHAGDQPEAAQQSIERLAVELSLKPFMNILWFGSVLVILGSIIALRLRTAA